MDFSREVFDDQVNTIPPAGGGLAAVGHRTPGRARWTAQQQSEIAARDIGERREGLGDQRETEVRGVEVDRGVDIIHHVADVDGGHGASSVFGMLVWYTAPG